MHRIANKHVIQLCVLILGIAIMLTNMNYILMLITGISFLLLSVRKSTSREIIIFSWSISISNLSAFVAAILVLFFHGFFFVTAILTPEKFYEARPCLHLPVSLLNDPVNISYPIRSLLIWFSYNPY